MTLKQRLAFVLATGFGAGYSPFAPGTAGSAVGLLFVWAMSFMDLAGQVAFTLVVTVLSMIAADIVAKSVGLKDPGLIVADDLMAGLYAQLALRGILMVI